MGRARLHKTVITLGLVSLFTDFSSEMIYPLLPLFLTTVIGAGALSLGLIEGVAEATASLGKVGFGYLSDRRGRKKSYIAAGYGLAGFARPLIGLAGSWPAVLGLRFLDRAGKGIRTAPRDALIAQVTEPTRFGAAYGFHRAMDHAGAVAGPLGAALLLSLGVELRHVFLLAVIPAVAALALIIFRVEEPPTNGLPSADPRSPTAPVGSDTVKLLAALGIFTLGNSTDAFLLLRLSEAGLSAGSVALVWSAHHVVKMGGTYLGGLLSDRFGRKPLVASGWVFYAGVYGLFALVEHLPALIVLFLAYGLYYGLTEPSEKAWIADLAPVAARGRAFGLYNGVIGLAALPASLIFGFVWTTWGHPAAFGLGACLALISALMLAGVAAPRRA